MGARLDHAVTVQKVLHLITTLDRGGAENALLHLCRGLLEAGFEPSVAFLKGAGELTPEFEAAGVPVHALGRRGLAGVGAYGRARRLVRQVAPALVHTHLFKADCLGAAVVGPAKPGRPVLVSTKHNEDAYLAGAGPKALAIRGVARRVARRADAVIAISDGVARFVGEWIGDAAEPVRTIRYGVPCPGELPAGTALRSAWGASIGEAVLLCVARLVEQKDHATLLDALSHLRTSRPFRLVLLGRGPLEDALRLRAGASDLVVFAGFLEDPWPAFAAADVVVLSSRHEGLGLVLVEAALAGKPVVATAVGGIPEVVEDGGTGLLVPPGDPEALAEAIDALLDDPVRAAALGGAGRQRARERFDPRRYIADTTALYGELLEARP